MSENKITSARKIVIITAVVAALLSVTATLVTYYRSGKINAAPFIIGIIIPSLAVILTKPKSKLKIR